MGCPRLQDLDMQYCSPRITAKGLQQLFSRNTCLRSLILKSCTPVDDSLLHTIGTSLGTHLETRHPDAELMAMTPYRRHVGGD